MSSYHTQDMFSESHAPRSPASLRHQNQIPRQSSRQFVDGYATLPPNLYGLGGGTFGSMRGNADDRISSAFSPQYGNNNFDMTVSDPWNATSYQQNQTIGALGTQRNRSTKGRNQFPPGWGLDSNQPAMPQMMGNMGMPPMSMQRDLYPDPDEELIPTAIVIKNIPFAVKKEQLVQLMTDMRLPLPYAFNYHFDNGVFRGLAFANFTTPEETGMVIESLNQIELQGRKLRVEYKKMLPAAERERIEREKRERRGQLQSQHEQSGMPTIHQQPSLQSIASNVPHPSPSPVSARNNMKLDCDLNDPQVLKYYSQLLLFKEDLSRETMTFPATLTPIERRTVHTLAHHMNLAHVAKGVGDQRQVHVFRVRDVPQNMSPPIPQMPHDPHRRALNRAATTDFSDVRGNDFSNTLGRQTSGFLGLSEPGGLNSAQNLRSAKSYADLRSYTPSPAQSTASYPANANYGRFDLAMHSGQSTNPSLTPTNTTMAGRDESLLVNGLGNMTLGSGFGAGGSPRGMRQAWERDTPGPIGGHRSFSNFDDAGRVPTRQPRGPVADRNAGFPGSRRANGHHGRGSDDASSHSGNTGVEIVVE